MTKKIIASLIVALVLFFALAAVIYLIVKLKTEEAPPGTSAVEEKTMQERIDSVTAPERAESLSKEEQKRIDNLMKSVTASAPKDTISEIEQQRIQKLLESAAAPQ